jgi:hypothetical protein
MCKNHIAEFETFVTRRGLLVKAVAIHTPQNFISRKQFVSSADIDPG